MAMHKWKTSGLTLLIGRRVGLIPKPVHREEQNEYEFSRTIIIR